DISIRAFMRTPDEVIGTRGVARWRFDCTGSAAILVYTMQANGNFFAQYAARATKSATAANMPVDIERDGGIGFILISPKPGTYYLSKVALVADA
ncbi:MAG: hypothetical protein ACREJC_06690, partial [Tepidisphaeraceae bacterium]